MATQAAIQGQSPQTVGKIWSLEGNIYLAYEVNIAGDIIQRSETAFKCVNDARDWLQDHGVGRVYVEQSSAYSEMIGSAE